MKKHFLLAFLVVACSSPSSKNEQAADSVALPDKNSATVDPAPAKDSATVKPLSEATTEEVEMEAEDPRDDAVSSYSGKYKIPYIDDSVSGSLELTYQSGRTFLVYIYKSAPGGCEDEASGEITIDDNNTGAFDYEGRRIFVTLGADRITVGDPDAASCTLSAEYIHDLPGE